MFVFPFVAEIGWLLPRQIFRFPAECPVRPYLPGSLLVRYGHTVIEAGGGPMPPMLSLPFPAGRCREWRIPRLGDVKASVPKSLSVSHCWLLLFWDMSKKQITKTSERVLQLLVCTKLYSLNYRLLEKPQHLYVLQEAVCIAQTTCDHFCLVSFI